ncbi:MAG: rRNA maturation RNase YbeY [Clostridia bacterium]|nr:rRNA maturation RNase YbeY [Clostridia bacterium]
MSVKVNIFNRQKKITLPTGTKLLIRKACNATLKLEGFENSAEVDVTIVDDDEIWEINREQRNIDRATDVLSFPLGENGEYDQNPSTGALMLGDIVISAETAVRQADLYGHSIEREFAFLTVHSMLHLLGYDHVDGGLEQAVMREKEEKVLDALGLSVNKI